MAGTWKTRWEELRSLGEGGQACTLLVRRRDLTDPNERVLKVFKSPKDPERRARMSREVAALRKLDGPGIPKLLEDNSGKASASEPLYAVMEFVPGPTLEQHVRGGPRPLEEGLAIVHAVVEIVERCHQLGLRHRDIKPDNILLRDGKPTSPVLIDFGLSVDADDQDFLTEMKQQIGNRFLLLPEHRTPGSDKRDPRSDITLCVALLFYLLTGRHPVTLEDEEGRPPHKRSDVQPQLRSLESRQLVPLTHLFDLGFRSRFSERVQSIDRLRELLDAVRHGAAGMVEKAVPEVASLWTLHMVFGEPQVIYFHHRLASGSDLAPFFDGNQAPISCDSLPEEVAQAAGVIRAEILARREVRAKLPPDREFHRAFDHINHVLDAAWSGGAAPTHLRWSREMEIPGGRESGPSADIPLAALSAGATAAIGILDRAARARGAATLKDAIAKRASW